MNQEIRIPSTPLITHDPYFSVWSPSDCLFGADTVHWTGKRKRIEGTVTDGEQTYSFLGAKVTEGICQTGHLVTPLSSSYTFETKTLRLKITFTSPVIASDLELVSRPCTYISIEVQALDHNRRPVCVEFQFDEEFCYDTKEQVKLYQGTHTTKQLKTAWMGRAKQLPLSHCGDHTTIDWGYLHLALEQSQDGEVRWEEREGRKKLTASLKLTAEETGQKAFFVAAYDDILSIMYFESARKAYWARDGKTIYQAMEEAVEEYPQLMIRCKAFEEELLQMAIQTAGSDYAALCTAAYRQSVAAHKLIRDTDGKVVFLSKECDSNGCIGTVDISYPSSPLYLLLNPELLRGMIRPVLKFALCEVWGHDFAPHDVGCYPYATGQVYGLDFHNQFETGDVFPPFYSWPSSEEIYPFKHQMPVEECGNMLLMIAAALGTPDFIEELKSVQLLLDKWAGYLIEYGEDPNEQLCTDDFAGHLAHNVNLAIKACVGIGAYSKILEAFGEMEKAKESLKRAKKMAASITSRCQEPGHTVLAFDRRDSWSLKYNLIWDILFALELFPKEFYEQEIAWYLANQNELGVPLDSRKTYTKSDWILWCAAVAETKEQREQLIAPVYQYLSKTPDRVPFSDWYDTVSGHTCGFKNRTVQGGIFMPLLRRQWEAQKKSN